MARKNRSTNPAPPVPDTTPAAPRKARARWLFVVVMVLLGTNLAAFAVLFSRKPAAPADSETPVAAVASASPVAAAASASPVATAQVERPYRPFKVVNMHEHLYRLQDLDKYLAACATTGIAQTVFVASSNATHLGSRGKIDEGNEWNTEEILSAWKAHPDDVIPFCTIFPGDPDKLQKLRDYVGKGSKGLKLFSGHSQFHERPLDDPSMLPVYAYCEEIGLPICWHVRLDRFYDEFVRVMEQHPRLKVILPHFGVMFYQASEGMAVLGGLLDRFPNLYTDTSFGTREILVQGLEIVSANPDFFSAFFERYQDRIVFGTDMVVTGNSEKTQNWVEAVIRACRDVLEREHYTFFMAAAGSGYEYEPAMNTYGELRGLNLPNSILKKIYETNPQKLFSVN